MMKRLFCALVAFLALLAQAAPVSSAQARRAARAWTERNVAFGAAMDVAGAAKAVTNSAGVVLWYRVPMTDGSCIVVSPVTELEPVIAVLENVPAGGLPVAHPMRRMLERDMADRLKKLGLYVPVSTGPSLMGAAQGEATPSDPVMAAWAVQGRSKWENLGIGGGVRLMEDKQKGVDDITTFVSVVDGFEKGGRFTHWDQSYRAGGYCYNLYTPNNAVCGCVATAMAAMLQYFGVKECPSGVQSPDGVRLASYGGDTSWTTMGGEYDWSIFESMTNRVSYNDLTLEQREMLGKVAYDAGVAVGMGWTDEESGAYTKDVAPALREVFGFKDARAITSPNEANYAKFIYNQCRAGAPVALGISGEGGHAVLAVGYGIDADGNPRVRVFTGWGGSGDGWYALPYINTKSLPSQSGSYLFDVVDDVITMVGYETDETVPVVGQVIPASEDTEVVLPNVLDPVLDDNGDPTEETVPRTLKVSGNGYFGTRVSAADFAGKSLTIQTSGKSVSVSVGKDAKDSSDENKLAAALPDAVLFMLLENTSWALTFADALALAEAEGKAVLRVSSTGSSNIVDRIMEMDKDNIGGFADKFVYQPVDYVTSLERDGKLTFGVFLPSEASEEDRWAWYNGRLAYGYGYSRTDELTVDNDYEMDEDDAGFEITNSAYVVAYNLCGVRTLTNFEYTVDGLLDAFQMTLDTGWNEFCRQTHGIELTVTAEPNEAGTPDPAYGTYTGMYTNGQTVTAVSMGELTNETAGVIMGCKGWKLTDNATGAEIASGNGTTAEFQLSSNDVVTLTWQVKTNAVWISVEDADGFGTTSPGSGWYKYGKQVKFVAEPDDGFRFVEWTGGVGRQLPATVKELDLRIRWLAFKAEEPFALLAQYDYGEQDDGDGDPYPDVPERRDLTDADVPVGNGGASSSPMDITPNDDGTLTLSVTVGNAVEGYWYALVTDTELDGAYDTVVDWEYADADGELGFDDIIIDPSEPKRFYKIRILEDEPEP